MKARYNKPEAVLTLEELATAAAHRRHPNNPAVIRRVYRDDRANDLTKCVIDYLRLNGCQAERINSTGRYITDGMHRGRWIYGSGQKGTADISATIRGRSVKIEIKIKDKESEDQKKYQQAVEAAGGVYLLVRSFTEFKQWFDQL